MNNMNDSGVGCRVKERLAMNEYNMRSMKNPVGRNETFFTRACSDQ